MKYGMNLLLWTDDPTKESFLPVLENLAKLGFDGVELPIFRLDEKRYGKLGRRLADMGLECTGVTVRTAEDDPTSADKAKRQLGVERSKRALDCCRAAGARLLAGPYYAALGHFSGKGPTAAEWRRSVDGMRQVAEHAGSLGVTLALEFLNRFEIYLLNCAADAARYVRDVDHPSCRMMYDTFHANIEEKDLGAAIEGCADVMVHVHVSENDRSTPGQGHVDWATTFDALHRIGYDGWLTIEAFGQSLPALAAATKIWRKMFVSEEQLAADGLRFMRQQWSSRARQRKQAPRRAKAKR
ncbi:MAG: sugar phosphate isomerase/epimerase [Planctomycetes bacterium]|nr:sugar phosphate isomerase/epimerase [Planctomycetota bacterium]MCB9885334.1 sugar phosphate isomerase/epimerase [Planctomycetota bacterium]